MNVHRERWNAGDANPYGLVEMAVDAAVGVEAGDLIWLDTDDAKPFSHAGLWTGTAAGSQGKAAEKFAGVAHSAHVAGDALVTTIRVATRGTHGFPLQTAAAFEVGDLVGPSKHPSSNLLQAQVVDKVSNESFAIGRAQKRYASAVAFIEFEIFTRIAAGGGVRNYLTS